MGGPKKPSRRVKGYQRCSACDARGHNARNPKCPQHPDNPSNIEKRAAGRALDALARAFEDNGMESAALAAHAASKKVKP